MYKKLLMLLVFVLWAMPVLAEVVVDTAWVRRYNDGGMYVVAIAVDDSNNVYVTGDIWGNGLGPDYATIKYYPNGDTAWVRRYNGPGDDYDVPYAIAVDALGNVYVTGESYTGVATQQDYATVRYDANGNPGWIRKYNGPGNTDDTPFDIAIDGSRNVYVTGRSFGIGTGADYATIKYYPNGSIAWVKRYDGTENLWDEASAIAVDGSGNVYVTGRSNFYGSQTYGDYATIKYDPNGNELWIREYNGPADTADEAHDIAVDDSGNVYVTGGSYGVATNRDWDWDYATIKYYPDGDTAWVRRYNGPGNSHDLAWAIAVDGSGNVYVTGFSIGDGTERDCATIKYYPDGETAWVRRYAGPGTSMDQALDMALDGSNNVYVIGSTGECEGSHFLTVKYDSEGNELWVQTNNGSGWGQGDAIALDGSDNVIVTGYSSEGIATVKYLQFLRGDANRDEVIDIGDVVYLINYLYKGGSAPVPLDAGDANCDVWVDVGDIVYLINYLFKGGPPLGC